ncbi:hypothetical protein [Polyangium sp. 6x1]|uniref:hypothetical protein n=1 Tax=Polyangium sp. 6x1 TaxID=3042689 RepID=UPI00248263BD|nr:hypothetical protein [Polyangium sp. 6x1]MDI1449553.1 hypothetical protein [Polyangium sp. 6x1]
MSEGSRVFERVAEELERLSKLSRLEARGTLRLALREAGFLPKNVTPRSMVVVLERTLPISLLKRGVRDAATICYQMQILVRETMGMESSEVETPERVFARIGRATAPPAPSSSPDGFPSSGMTPPRVPSFGDYDKPPTGRLSAVPRVEKKAGNGS